MINELLWLVLLAFNFGFILLAYRLFGKTGIYVWTVISVILANIQVMKMIEIFGLVTAMGNIVYSSLFLTTDILNEFHSKKDAQKAVWIGFFALIATTIIMQVTLMFAPHESDVLNGPLKQIFSFLPRIAFASIVAYSVSQFHDVWIFAKLKIKMKGKKLWLRNNVSTISSQLLDNVVFTSIAFIGLLPFGIIVEIFITSIILKIIVAGLDTPFLYLAKRIKKYKPIFD